MLFHALLFLAGAAALYFGAEWLVRGASHLARSLGISQLVVGLTVVALGTSAPELVVSTVAAVRGQGGLAFGNVVGSNVLNLALILGLAAVIHPLKVDGRLVIREAPIMIAASIFFPLLAWDLRLSRTDGLLLLAAFAAYLLYVVRSAVRESAATPSPPDAAGDCADAPEPGRSRLRSGGLVVAGTVVLVTGAQGLVEAAVFFARSLGISELIIGLTVVAIGTSLPELATSLVAAARHEADIALGNAIGSNIFNSLLILGVAALAHPVPVSGGALSLEVLAMIGISILFVVLAYTRRTLAQWEGAVLLAGYVAFTAALLHGTVG